MLLKSLVSMHVESCGESAPPLERVKPKYLVVSPAMDNLSMKDIEAIKDLLSPISLSKNCWVNKGNTWCVTSVPLCDEMF